MEPVIQIVIEDADGILRVSADRPVRVLLLRWDDLLAEPQPEDIEVSVDLRRVERLFRNHTNEEE